MSSWPSRCSRASTRSRSARRRRSPARAWARRLAHGHLCPPWPELSRPRLHSTVACLQKTSPPRRRSDHSLRTEFRRPCRRACRRRRPSPACARASRAREPKSSPQASAPPPPPPRVSSMVSCELKPCSTTSVEYLLVAVLVGAICASAAAFEINLRALLEILLGDLAQPFVEDHHAVPLGLFLALAGGLVAPAFRGGDAADWRSAGRPGCGGFPDPCRDCRSGSLC